jgi:biotin carboxyl carrier protein
MVGGASGDDAMKVEIAIDGRTAKLEVENGKFRYEREEIVEREYSMVPLTPGSFSVLIDGRSYHVVASGGEVRVNGRAFAVEVFDPRSLRSRKSAGVGEGRIEIAAMMPGKVVRVLVAEGDEIEAGAGLVVVEAMKMQNEMKSPKAGRVVEVKTKPEATVAAGEVLMVIE